MALQNQEGVYLKITHVDFARNYVSFDTYKDADVRANPTHFDAVHTDGLVVGTLPAKMDAFATTGNIRDDLIACGYLALKEEPPYNGAGGEVWTDC